MSLLLAGATVLQNILIGTAKDAIGSTANAVVVAYSASHYHEKIQKLSEYDAKLQGHKDNLVGLMQQIRLYWETEAADKYTRNLQKEIEIIDDQSKRIKEAKAYFEEVIGDFKKVADENVAEMDRIANRINAFIPD